MLLHPPALLVAHQEIRLPDDQRFPIVRDLQILGRRSLKARHFHTAVSEQGVDITLTEIKNATEAKIAIGNAEGSAFRMLLESALLEPEMEDPYGQSELAVFSEVDGVPACHLPVLEDLFQREILLFDEHECHPA